MVRIVLNNITLEVIKGDITIQPDIQIIVNAANAQLEPGGGVAGAIHRIGGPELISETSKFSPINPGDAVLTAAPNFPNRFIIHCLGPVYGKDKPEEKILRNCYVNALHLADENNAESIAFPAISTGVFGYPVRDAAKTAFTAIAERSPYLENVKRVRMVLWSEDDFTVHNDVLQDIQANLYG